MALREQKLLQLGRIEMGGAVFDLTRVWLRAASSRSGQVTPTARTCRGSELPENALLERLENGLGL